MSMINFFSLQKDEEVNSQFILDIDAGRFEGLISLNLISVIYNLARFYDILASSKGRIARFQSHTKTVWPAGFLIISS